MNYIYAFLVGGLLCVPAQILLDKTKLSNARILTGYVVSGVILGALGLYEPIVNFASAGATVPLTGFGYTLFKGVKESVDENGLLGALSGGLKSTAAGISAALFFSTIWALCFRSKQK